MRNWMTMVEPGRQAVRLLVTDRDRNELLKARLPAFPQHPRALLTLLEGLALWVGEPLTAVVSAGPSLDLRCGQALFADGLLPIDSALVRFDVVTPAPRRRRTIAGVGDFRSLRLLGRRA
jgi:hypothetical protein